MATSWLVYCLTGLAWHLGGVGFVCQIPAFFGYPNEICTSGSAICDAA